MTCTTCLQNYFDQFMGTLTELFAQTAPTPGGVYPSKNLIKRVSNDANDDDISTCSDMKMMEKINTNRRRSTTYLMKEKTSNVSSKRRTSLAPQSIGDNQLKSLTINNSNIIATDKRDDFGLGTLILELHYDLTSKVLQVYIQEAKKLPAVDTGGKCDPYLKITIYPGKYPTLKSKTHYKTRDPKFDETKVFNAIPELDLKMMTMNVKILDWNRLDDKNDRIIGEVNYSLNLLADAIVTNNKKTIRFEKNIVPIRDTENGCGLLFMSLYLDMGKEEMIVSIIKGKNLKAMDSDNLSDPYCILRLSTPTSKLGTRKTSVKLKTLNPIWNESFPFHVTEKDFANNLSLKVKVYDKDKVGSDVIGEINFSCQSSFAEMRHWKTMISRQREKKPEWHSVRYIT